MKFNLVKSLVATAALALSAGAAHAVGTNITIQESAIPGALSNQIVVNQLSGQYDELVTTTATSTTGGTFVSEGIFSAGGWFGAGVIQSQLNGIGANGYGLYAQFTSSGSFSINNGITTFNVASATIFLYADPNENTLYKTKSNPDGSVNPGIHATGSTSNLVLQSGGTTASDDFLLGSATALVTGTGTANPGVANGNFEFIFSGFSLTDPGSAYFIAPRPFNLLLDLNGNFQNFTPSTTGTGVTDIGFIGSSANAFFNPVPEPSALALAGIALLGAAMVTRRKNRQG